MSPGWSHLWVHGGQGLPCKSMKNLEAAGISSREWEIISAEIK